MGALSENSFHEARKLENLFLFTLYELKRRPGCRWPHLSGAPRGPIGWGASRGAAALTCGRSAECWFYPLRKGCLTIFIFLLNLEISDNAGRLGSGCQRPMWKSLSLRGRARKREGESGSEGRRGDGAWGEEMRALLLLPALCLGTDGNSLGESFGEERASPQSPAHPTPARGAQGARLATGPGTGRCWRPSHRQGCGGRKQRCSLDWLVVPITLRSSIWPGKMALGQL